MGGGEGERKSEQAQSVCLVVVVVPNKQVRPGFGVAGSMRVKCVWRSVTFTSVRTEMQVSLGTWESIYR